MGRARVQQQTEEEIKNDVVETEVAEETAEEIAEETANTGDEAVDAFLNGETEKVPEGTEEISTEEAENMAKNEKVYLIEAPNKNYNGTTATVDFKDGKGYCSNKVILEYFKKRGYKITEK